MTRPALVIVPRDPITPAEWQAAVDAATFMLALDSCTQYGLITGGPVANVARCEDIIDRGRARGVIAASLDTLIDRYVAKGSGR